MVLDTYGHLFKAAESKVSTAMDEAFDRAIESGSGQDGRKTVVDSTVPNKNETRKPLRDAGQRGGDVRIRTADPLHAKQVLYQLSYTPTG